MVQRNQGRIEALKNENDSWVQEPNMMKNMIRNYYDDLFKKDASCDINSVPKGEFAKLQSEDWREMNKPFSEEEIKRTVFDMAPFKSPGPDGIHACFYQRTWEVVGSTAIRFAQKFFETGEIEKGVNDTSIVLIPKVNGLETVKQFRPISLCNVDYKFLTKIMIN